MNVLLQSNLAIRNGLIRNKLAIRNHFLWPICHLFHKDNELLALRNNSRATKKFLIAKFDCTWTLDGWSMRQSSHRPKVLYWGLSDFYLYCPLYHRSSCTQLSILESSLLGVKRTREYLHPTRWQYFLINYLHDYSFASGHRLNPKSRYFHPNLDWQLYFHLILDELSHYCAHLLFVYIGLDCLTIPIVESVKEWKINSI